MAAFIFTLILLGGWESLVQLGAIDPLILPAPSQVATAMWIDRGQLSSDLGVTAYEVLIGLGLAIIVGAVLAIVMHLFQPMRKTLHPFVVGSQAVPILVVAPLFVLVFGFGLAPKILMVALVCFFPVTINLYDGLRRVDPEARQLLKTLKANRWQTFRLLEAPSAFPAMFSGLKIAAAIAVIGAVFAEWAGSSSGLGHTLLIASGQLETARAFAATVLLFALAITIYGLFALAERRTVTQTPRGAQGRQRHREKGTPRHHTPA